MRIRKNSLRVPSESSSGLTAPLQPHFCQLNQSPWDLSPSSPSSPSLQVEGDIGLLQNKGFGDLIGGLESFASLRKSLECEDNGNVYDYEKEKNDGDSKKYCLKTDENGNWICGLEVKEGETFCEFHLRSYIVPNVVPSAAKKSTTKKPAKKSKADLNPYESVYYSGFEPTWGKRKIARELSKMGEAVAMPEEESENSEDSEEAEQDGNEEIEAENSSENEKKRGRKLMKARSLKSLM
ncbi:hypothetical protein ACET3Z_013659 [Daucus carota]